MTQIEQALRDLLGEIAGRREPIGQTGSLLGDYGLDSLQAVELIARLEQRYGVVFGADPGDMEALESLAGLAAWVTRRAPAS
jgi:acyl carrier protein